jgi:hypothetical protein
MNITQKMVSSERFEREVESIERELSMATEEYKPYWEYYKKGFCAWYFAESYQEKHLHRVRMGWVDLPDASTRMKGSGYLAGFNHKDVIFKKRGRKKISERVNNCMIPVETMKVFKEIARIKNVPLFQLQRAAITWYCTTEGKRLGIDAFNKSNSEKKDQK